MADKKPPRAASNRDSHDLSLRDVTRDSLVANMLLSLDQMSLGQAQSHRPLGAVASPTYTYGDGYSTRPKPSRGSDADNLGTLRETPYRSQPGSPPLRNPHAGPGRLGNRSASDSSASASIDAASQQRHGRGIRRSASFDLAPPPPPLQHFAVEFPDSFDDDYSAAPTPTVPSGPRREPSGLLPRVHLQPPPPPEPVEPRSIERKRSPSRSLKSSTARSKRANGHRAPPEAAAPAMPIFELDSAPAPSVGYRKAKEAEASARALALARERPGFFRRVFGGGGSSKSLNASSSSNSNISDQDRQTPSRFPTSPERLHNNGTSRLPPHMGQSAVSAPPSRDTSASSLSHHQTLQKKSSSFFRRRKKSATDEPPPLPNTKQAPSVRPLDTVIGLPSAAKELAASAQKSPTSSLRTVMNPYLTKPDGAAGLGLSDTQKSPPPLVDTTNTPGDRTTQHAGRPEYKRGFSPDYEPSPNARIRTVHSDDEGEQTEASAEAPSRPAPERQPRGTSETASSSFLDLDGTSDREDGSSNEHKKKKPKSKGKDKDASDGPAAATPDDGDADATIRASKKHTFAAVEQTGRDPTRSKPGLPAEGTSATSLGSCSTETDYKTAPSAPPSVRVESHCGEPGHKMLGSLDSIKAREPLDEPDFVVGEPTEDDRQKAQQIYDGCQGFIPKDKAASWMGEEGPVRQRTLQAYMELHDFKDQSILNALRSVCGRLVLRAETQQVDRILVAFAKQWCASNPHHGFKATDVIHTICYSIMLLNTDLHLADIEQKMTRSQFVKNTMTTIMQAVSESAPGAFSRLSILPERNSMLLGADCGRSSPDHDRANRRSSFLPRSDTMQSTDVDDCGPLVKAPFSGTMRAWEEQVEIVLKNTYASIRDQRLPLFGADPDKHLGTLSSQNGLSVMNMLKRSPSVLSKTPSETQLSSRGRITDTSRTSASRWASKSRSRPGVGRNGFSSSRTSFEDGSSMWSPAMSSATWSRYSLGRTQGSMSQDSFTPPMPRGDYQKSIGFANALSQAIVRDEEANSTTEAAPSILSSDMPSAQLLEDESLELAGPPWVKEGMVIHKHHLDGVGKRTRDRNWAEVFAVIQKGQLSLFSFTSNKSARQKSRAKNAEKHSGPVGGGNWQDNAVSLGTFNLRLTLASALPPPGYSRTRPHVWALSLPTGAVHLFQVGTPEIIREFVNTANYWSARLSTHPLVGGVSNIEYGWSEVIVNNALVSAINESATSPASADKSPQPGSSAAHGRKSSVASGTFRASSFDQVAGSFTNSSGRGGKLPADRIHVSEWAPPTQSMRPSKASEAEQLEALAAYVKGVEDELQVHNQLRSPMLLAFTPRGQNAGKAMANWERKSAYLLREIVKFRTYVECLRQAEARKKEVYAERELAHKAARGELSDGDMDVSDNEEGDETLRP